MPLQRRYRALLRAADRDLALAPVSVMDKTALPPSGDRHDFLSWPTYAWPDPRRPGHFRSIDGRYNPVRLSDRFDFTSLTRMVDAVGELALAYHYSRDPRYAAHAARLIRTWFVDPATRMNPNLRFAQFYPGDGETNGLGIIGTWRFVTIVDAVGLIAPSGALSRGDQALLRAWFARYADWLRTSSQGRKERARGNNHGVYYRAQLLDYALFAGDVAAARRIAVEAAGPLAHQIDRRGVLVNEIDRADATHYLLYGTRAWMTLAALAECAGVDLWHYRSVRTGGLRAAYAFLADYTARGTRFPATGYAPEKAEAYALLEHGAWAYAAPPDPGLARRYLSGEDPSFEPLVMPPR